MKRIVRLVNLYPPYIVGGNELLTYDTGLTQDRIVDNWGQSC